MIRSLLILTQVKNENKKILFKEAQLKMSSVKTDTM